MARGGRGALPAAALAITIAAFVAGAGASPSRAGEADPNLAIEVVSTRPEYVSGGDALVAVTLPAGRDGNDARITVDGEATRTRLTQAGDGSWHGLVDGLPEGESAIAVAIGGNEASVTVTNHPATGPLFSGPHLPLPVCTTEQYGLGAPTDDDCSAATRVTWSYRTTDGSFEPLADPSARPANLAEASPGVPFIVREEQGTINRGIYWIRLLEPNPTGADAFDDSGWNERLVYTFGGGCGAGYTQGFTLLSDPNPDLLAEGYAFATSTFNTFQVACNATLSAESALMVKERFVERYGLPAHTIGFGGSGGAIQQYQVAQNYPGILDAVGAVLPFPDAVSVAAGVIDCLLLNSYYRTPAGASLTPEQRVAVNGHMTGATCDFWESTFATNVDPQAGCSLSIFNAAGDAIEGLPGGAVPELDPADVYDADTNPDGLRCTLQDSNVNVIGRDPDTGFARRPLDNTGVQYGLEALNAGVIDFEQFLELNRSVGGVDIDGQPTPERIRADDATIRRAYRTGGVSGGGPLSELPVISVNVWTDPQGDIHDRFRAFSLRDRLAGEETDRVSAEAPGHMIWTRELPEGDNLVDALTGTVKLDAEVIHVLDEWLDALDEDADGDLADRLERTRPEAALDNCVTPSGERVSREDLYETPGPCTDPYPLSGDPRTAAGAPRSNDVLACSLRPVDAAIDEGEYGDALTDEQRAALEEVFPDGVCDWSERGRGRAPLGRPWRDYGE
jgi:Tannase-like family of unknown function (DUF6351)